MESGPSGLSECLVRQFQNILLPDFDPGVEVA